MTTSKLSGYVNFIVKFGHLAGVTGPGAHITTNMTLCQCGQLTVPGGRREGHRQGNGVRLGSETGV